MLRDVLRTALCALFLFSLLPTAYAQDTSGKPPADTSSKSASDTKSQPSASSAGVMQVKKNLQGELSYRFVEGKDKAYAPISSPVPLPSPAGADNLVAISVPSNVNLKSGILEVLDNTKGNLARMPVETKKIVELSESGFNYAQRVNVAVQSKGLGVVGAQVMMTAAKSKFSQSKLLQAEDMGVARFENVPLNEPVTVSVSYNANPAESQTKTLTTTRSSAEWGTISVSWADAKTVAPPPTPTTTQPTGAGTTAPPIQTDAQPRTQGGERDADTNPFSSLLSTLVSIVFLAGIVAALFWAWKNGYIQGFLTKLGVTPEPPAASASMPDPFGKQRAPIQPITEGTADPLVSPGLGGAVVSASMAPAVSPGPRLVGTSGIYSGTIFPISGVAADIGRDTTNAIPLPNDTNTSRRHATLQMSGTDCMVVDNGSSNGTFVNGVKITPQTPSPIRPGDEIQIGMTRFRYEA